MSKRIAKDAPKMIKISNNEIIIYDYYDYFYYNYYRSFILEWIDPGKVLSTDAYIFFYFLSYNKMFSNLSFFIKNIFYKRKKFLKKALIMKTLFFFKKDPLELFDYKKIELKKLNFVHINLILTLKERLKTKTCLFTFFFKLRNFFLTLNAKKIFFSYSTGLITEFKNSRSNLEYQTHLIKLFFFNLNVFFKKDVKLQFNRPSRKMSIFFLVVMECINNLNLDILKKNYFVVSNIFVKNRLIKLTYKYKKKPRKKKIFSKNIKKFKF